MENYILRRASIHEADAIWEILQFAIEKRRQDGSLQWQDGYPNLETVKNDIAKSQGFVFVCDDQISAYCAIIINDEPAYRNIEGKWLTNGDFVVVHRVATAPAFSGKGLSQKLFSEIEKYALQNDIYSIKVDTNFDNATMLKILERCGYTYCGKVFFRGGERLAFEKVLKKNQTNH